MNIDTAHYGYLTTNKQKRRFYRVIIPFGKWYI